MRRSLHSSTTGGEEATPYLYKSNHILVPIKPMPQEGISESSSLSQERLRDILSHRSCRFENCQVPRRNRVPSIPCRRRSETRLGLLGYRFEILIYSRENQGPGCS
jgi:hypothetical protein